MTKQEEKPFQSTLPAKRATEPVPAHQECVFWPWGKTFFWSVTVENPLLPFFAHKKTDSLSRKDLIYTIGWYNNHTKGLPIVLGGGHQVYWLVNGHLISCELVWRPLLFFVHQHDTQSNDAYVECSKCEQVFIRYHSATPFQRWPAA